MTFRSIRSWTITPPEKSVEPLCRFNLAPEKQPPARPRIELELDESIIGLRNASSTTLDFVDPDKAAKSPDDEAWADALLQDDPIDDCATAQAPGSE